ncbi:hypothetical protein KKC63_02365, partial [Patescibacteria group bacterium]|nr:hypothetical protein [Patescibacteria group bacterium]MBU4022821.1 hypothetical protein [Patescibacteria group bacterium]
MINKKLKQQGTTLIEILITISMITILLGVAFWGYRDRGRELDLKRSALELVANLEKTREMAMSSTIIGGGTERPEGGYGIRFIKNQTSYILFADRTDNKSYDAGAGELDSTIFLKDGVSITIVSPADTTDIVFSPPSPDVYINGSDTISAEITIGNSIRTEKIIINPAG